MRYSFLIGFIVLGAISLGIKCSDTSTEKQDTLAEGSDLFVSDTLPPGVDTATVDFRDLNFYTSNDHFCIVGIVDNTSRFWRKIWLKAQLTDSTGRVLQVDGDSLIVFRTFSDAVAPRGATAFFTAIPLKQINGTPVDCQIGSAGALERGPGAILLASDLNGVRVLLPDSTDNMTPKELVYNLQFMVNNPLDLVAYHPRVVLLVYGKDERLYFAQLLDPELENSLLTQEEKGPLAPREMRKHFCQIYYEMLPEPLQAELIGRVEVQVFDAR